MSSLPRLAAMAALVCLCAVMAGCGHGSTTAQDPESAANAFFAEVEKGDTRTAYDSAAFNFQVAQTFEGFRSNAQELGFIGGQPPVWKTKTIKPTEARLDGTLMSQAGSSVNVSVTLTPEGKEWKLFALRTATGGEDAEPQDQFTLVGKGTGFNDVYHQPMPGPKKLADLVHDTMAKFNTAIRAGDFGDFYRDVSQQWKDGQRVSGEATAGVTEKMLKDHFQQFTDMKIDISEVAGLTPVFDQPPLIDDDGLLILNGHFDTPQYKVNFHLEYAYELPRWKLFGIDVSLTK